MIEIKESKFHNVTLKLQHEQFVSNLTGTTFQENYLLITLPIILNTCLSFLSVNLFQLGYGNIKGKLFVNYLFVVVPYILSITVYSNYLYEITVTTAVISIILACNSLLLSRSSKYKPELRVTLHQANDKHISWLFLSQMRGLILVMTSICILAVDMPVFPRRFAKTENYGLGPMDLGVAMFSLIYGVLERINDNSKSKRSKLPSVAILVCLGLLRTVLVKFANYQEHESEYGTHWNFFLTMAVIRLLSIVSSDLKILRSISGLVVAILIVGMLQHVLLHGSWQLEDYCLRNDADRTGSIIVANKEGLISLVGYLLLWIIGRLLGALLTTGERISFLILSLLSTAAVLSIKFGLFLNVSRRAANIDFVIWSAGCFCCCLVVLISSDLVNNLLEDRANYVTDTNYPDVYSVANSRGMAHFLFCNLLTGIVNKSVNTLNLDSMDSIGLLSVYSAAPILIISIFNSNKKTTNNL